MKVELLLLGVVLKMPLSKNIISKESAESMAINYEPITIGSQMSDQAIEYVNNHDARGDFRVDKVVAKYVGIDELEKESQQREIADQALKLSQEVQEKAYEEAYALGRKEGQDYAYQEEKNRIQSEMEVFKKLIEEIKNLKTDLMIQNEKQIVNLCFYMSKRLLMKEVETDPAYIQTLIKRSLEMAQSDEEVTIRVSSQDKQWIDDNMEDLFKDLDLGQSTKIEEDSQIKRGGVIIETNHGVIDATFEQRLEKLETIVKSQS
jgi:flagellar assembly protein FliH